MSSSVIILTDSFDPTADRIVERLTERSVELFRCDIAEFPERLSVSATLLKDRFWSGKLATDRREISLDELTGIYYRRPTSFELHPGMSAGERHWAGRQARMGFGGLLASVGPWLNHPHRIGFAEYKPTQLAYAGCCGLRVPRTHVTNDPESAAKFVADLDRAVCKPFAGGGVNDTDGFRQVFTRLITAEDCATDAISRTMHLFQEWIPKAYDVRVTVVDDNFFGVRIDAESASGEVDWRSDYTALNYRPIQIPAEIQERIRGLLDEFDLRFGALDFSVTDDGSWWFLELNPNGQWAWLEDETGLPISEAIADALTEGSG
jgi:ATP-grasp ribosomal peptide maturase